MPSKEWRHREMVREWFSWEYLIREDVKRLNRRFLKAQESMAKFGRWDVVHAYAIARLKQIIKEECSREVGG